MSNSYLCSMLLSAYCQRSFSYILSLSYVHFMSISRLFSNYFIFNFFHTYTFRAILELIYRRFDSVITLNYFPFCYFFFFLQNDRYNIG